MTEPRWPSRKILPVSLPWPPASTRPRRLSSALNAFQSRSSGTMRRGDRLRGVARVGEELEAERLEAGPRRRRRTPRGGRRCASAPSTAHQPDALVDLVDDRDRRRERRLAVGVPRRDGRAGRGRSAASSRSPSRPSARSEAAIMARPGAAIHAFCEPVTTTSTPQASISNGTAPRPDTLSTRMSASGAPRGSPRRAPGSGS